MAGAFDTVVDALKDAAGLFMKYPARLTLEFVKVIAIGMALQMALVLFITVVGMALGKEPGADAMSLAAVAAVLLAGLGFFVMSSTLSATQFCIIDQMQAGKKVDIISRARGLVPAVAAYCGIVVAVLVAVLALALVSGTVLVGLVGAFLMLLTLIGTAACAFLGQFALAIIAVRGTDAIGALKGSINLARKNFWAVFVFDVIMLVPVLGIIVVLSVPQDMINQAIASPNADAVLAAALFAVSLAFSLMESVLVSLMMTSFIYFFWKRMATPEGAEPAAAQAPANQMARISKKHSKQ